MNPDPNQSPQLPDDEVEGEWGEVANPVEESHQEDAVESDWVDAGGSESQLPAKRNVQSQTDVNHIVGERADELEGSKKKTKEGRPVTQLQVHEIKGKGANVRLDEVDKSNVKRVPKKEVSQDDIKLTPRGAEDWGANQGVDLKWVMIGGGVVIALVVGALVLLPSLNNPDAVVSNAEIREKAEKEFIEKRRDVIEKLSLGQDKAEQIYLDYVSAPIVDEVLPLLRDSKRVEPMVRDRFTGAKVSKTWDPGDGFSYRVVIDGHRPFGVLSGSLQNFEEFISYFVMENDDLYLDWEATVGYGSATFDELRLGVGDPSKIRGTIKPDVFYSASFPETKYKSFQLISPDGIDMIWCYAEIGTPGEQLMSKLFFGGDILKKEARPYRVTLALNKSVEGAAPNQWLIGGFWHVDWVSP